MNQTGNENGKVHLPEIKLEGLIMDFSQCTMSDFEFYLNHSGRIKLQGVWRTKGAQGGAGLKWWLSNNRKKDVVVDMHTIASQSQRALAIQIPLRDQIAATSKEEALAIIQWVNEHLSELSKPEEEEPEEN